MAPMAYGIGPGNAVFTTPFTFVATAEVISLLGATPVLETFEKWLRHGSEIFFASEWVTYKSYSLQGVKFNHAMAKNI